MTSWSGGRSGEVSFEDGLTSVDRGLPVQFFCQVRTHHGLAPPTVEMSLPFLWYWDARQDRDKWVYINEAGRDQDLIRTVMQEDSWRIEVRALELRHYLAARRLALVVQHDATLLSKRREFTRVDDKFRTDWCHFTWHCVSDLPDIGLRPSFARLLGQYVLKPLPGNRVPRWEERKKERDYPQFQYDVEAETGQPIRHTCDPDQLGTYFDPADSSPRPHYLTPAYSNREVLGRYTNEPSRYTVTPTRLTCLNLWELAISINSEGLVEVYLGDLGRDLPADEWPHWLGHNVSPSGSMAEDRFRRDFLNQPTASHDPVGDLRRARAQTQELARRLLGSGLWRELQGQQGREFDTLHPPTSRDPSALQNPVLTLTKSLVDALDPAPLRAFLGEGNSQGLKQLQLLEAFIKQLGGCPTIATPFRDAFRLRSSGGLAHLAGKDRDKVFASVGIADLTPHEAFDNLCQRLTEATVHLGSLIAGHESSR